MKMILIFLALITFAGESHAVTREVAQRKCKEAGHANGSTIYRNCVTGYLTMPSTYIPTYNHGYQGGFQSNPNFNNFVGSMGLMLMQPPAYRPMVNCTSHRMGTIVNTSCY
jgi:hypothetical protein